MNAHEARPPRQALGEKSPDPNVEAVRAGLLERSKVGLLKYGVTTADNPLSLVEWLTHLQQELMDAAVYVEAIKASIGGPRCTWRPMDSENMPGTWEAECGAVWTFTEDGPAENNLRFCPECGKAADIAANRGDNANG